MSISLCMIVRNEEAMLPRCLESVRHLADEMVIVDTGSVDKTMDIAKSFGARVYKYPWDKSFSNARNFALEKATMDWILLMDADDEFEREDTRNLLDLISAEKKTGAFYFRTLSFMGNTPDKSNTISNMNVRLLKNGEGYRFEGDIHEQLAKGSESECGIGFVGIRIYHYGYLNSVVASKNKRERNIALIKKELEKNPDDPFMLNNMGNECYSLRRFEDALDWYLKSYAHFDSRRGFSSKLLIRIVSCCDLLGKTKEQQKFIDEGLKIFPEFTDLEFIRANDYLRQRKYLAAIRSLKKCLNMGEPPLIYSYAVGIGSFKTAFVLSSVYHDLGDSTAAMRYCKMAIESNPEYREAYVLMGRILAENKTPVKVIIKKLERLVQPQQDVRKYILLSDIFYALRQYEAALNYIQKARELSPGNALYDYDEGVCRFYLKQYKQASDLFRSTRDREYTNKAMFLNLICARLDGSVWPEPPRGKNEYFEVFDAFEQIIREKKSPTLAEDAKTSQPYLTPIFSLMDILLKIGQFDWFDQSRQLLNLISDDSVLMRLGKLYFHHGFYELAYRELVRSLTLTGHIDAESLEMMKYFIGQKKI